MKPINPKFLLSCKTCWFKEDCGGTKEVIPGEPRKMTREECYEYQTARRNQWEQDNIAWECQHDIYN